MQIKGMNCRMLLILVKGIELKLLDGSTIGGEVNCEE